jgi:hypothetical protein
MKTGPDALGTVKNELGSTKHENGTRHPRNLPKRFRERKISKLDPVPLVPRKTVQVHKT